MLLLVFAFYSSCFAVNHIEATFEGTIDYTYYQPSDFLPGHVVPTAPNSFDRPCLLEKADDFTVENSTTVTGPALTTGNFMRIVDTDTYDANGAHFDFYDRTYDTGYVLVSWDVLFESYDNYSFAFYNGRGDDLSHPTKSNIADIYALKDKTLAFEDMNGRFFTTTYETGVPIHFECYFDLSSNRWAVAVNGEVLFNNAVIEDAPLGLFIVGYMNDQDVTGAMQVDNIRMTPRDGCEWPRMNAQCPSGLPDPQVVLTRTENAMPGGHQTVRLRFSVTNYNAYPASLFVPSSNLPPCGLNTNSSRTWIDIYDQDDRRLYGYCGATTPSYLHDLWVGAEPDMTGFRVVLKDRLCDREYRSNLVAVSPDMFAIVTVVVNGPGNVRTGDGFTCGHDQLAGSQSYTLTYLKGQSINLYPEPLDGNGYRSSFVGWSGGCAGTGGCTMTVTSDVTVNAQFGAVSSVPGYVGELPLPSSANLFVYDPVVSPVYDHDPSACKPFAAGDLSHGTMELQMGLPSFAGPVDVYLALYAPAINPVEIYLLVPVASSGYTVAPLSSGLVLWKRAKVDPGSQIFFGRIPLTVLPLGPYSLGTLVTPAGATSSTTDYYLWVSTFIVQ